MADPPQSRYYPRKSCSYTTFQTLTIQHRNKPKEAPKAAERAPFFLPTVAGLETRFDLSTGKDSDNENSSKRLAPLSSFLETDFTRRLGNERPDGDCKLHLVSFEKS